MRSFILSVTFLSGAFLCGPNVVLAQSDFAAGWFIVQPTAEFAVLQLAGSEVSGDSLTDAAMFQEVGIGTGEVVLLAFEFQNGTHLVFEWFGRLSVVRGIDALRPAPPGGRPAFVTEDVQLLDRVLNRGSAIWMTDIDAGTGTATVVLEGDREESVPSRAVSALMNWYSMVIPQPVFRPVF